MINRAVTLPISSRWGQRDGVKIYSSSIALIHLPGNCFEAKLPPTLATIVGFTHRRHHKLLFAAIELYIGLFQGCQSFTNGVIDMVKKIS